MNKQIAKKYELLIHAYQVISGIPEKNISFAAYYGSSKLPHVNSYHRCVRSPAQWLALYPMFNELGFSTFKNGTLKFGYCRNNAAIQQFFFGKGEEADDIFFRFDLYDLRPYDPDSSSYVNFMSDKEIFLYRIRKFLAKKGLK